MAGHDVPGESQKRPAAPAAVVKPDTGNGYRYKVVAPQPQAEQEPKRWKPYGQGPTVQTWLSGCSTGSLQGFSCYTTGAVYNPQTRGYDTPKEFPGLKEEITADIAAAETKFFTFMFAVLTENQPHWEVIREVLLERGWTELCRYHNMYDCHKNDKYMVRVFIWHRKDSQFELKV